jgi:puromycin-sensitive aminopeptidase
VAIRLEMEEPCASIELHAADLRVARPQVVASGRTLRGRLETHPERETIEVHLPERLPAGEATLRLTYSGRLRDDLRGLYSARSGSRSYAFTQLEATDARRFFPCFDEPSFKARFRVSVTTAAGHTVLANSPAQRVERRSAAIKTVHFAATPPLSSYLLALAVGELEGSRTVRCGRTPIRVWHVPGKGRLTRFALEAARECLARLEAYFDLPYPYDKLDLVAVPDFEAGAMENAGAVFFRETLLLVDPGTVTQYERKRVAEVICHELAHMWYGDLVTMAWSNDLWLNEAFATWMAFHVVDDWKPEWKLWNDFQHHRAAALDLDALENTHPIYTEVRNPAEATENFDLITYEKGASVVRMLERFLGARAFRAGVRRYIRRHLESNAEAADLWKALTQASGREVAPLVRAWIEQAGFPLLAVRRRKSRGTTRLMVRQERFLGAPPRRRQRAEALRRQTARWPVPVVARVGVPRGNRTRLVRALLEKTRMGIDLGAGEPRFVYANADEGGFFRPLHEGDELRSLARGLPSLAPVERMGLVSHQWAALRAGRAGVESLLELAGSFAEEEDADVLLTLRAPFAFLDQQVAPEAGGSTRALLHAWLADRFGPALRTLGFDARRGESDATRLRRAALFSLLGEVAEWAPVLEAASERFDAYLKNRRRVDPNLADALVTLATRRGDVHRFRALLDAMHGAATPQERRRFLLGLAEFRAAGLVDRSLALTLTPTVSTQDVALLLARLLSNPAAAERSWAFLKRRWSALRRRMPPMLITRVIDATPSLKTPAYRRDVAAFFRAHPVATGERAVRQALERFDRNTELRRRAAPGLRAWLGGPPPATRRRR